jgi:hypothetical protein
MALSEFERAFKAARALGDSEFEFRGKKFNTKLKEDMPAPKSEKTSTGATFTSDLSGRQKQMEIDRLRGEDKPLEGVYPETAIPALRGLRGLMGVGKAVGEARDRVEPYLRKETPALPAPRGETPALPAPRSEPKALGGPKAEREYTPRQEATPRQEIRALEGPKPERGYTPRQEGAVGSNPAIKQSGREVRGMDKGPAANELGFELKRESKGFGRGPAANDAGGVSAEEASRFGQGATKNPRGMERSEDRNPDMKKGGKVKAFAKGGKVSSASSRGDGCAQRGKTRGRMV